MTELKPCPFCGGKVKFNHNIELVPDGIYCPACRMLVRYYGIRAKKNEVFGVIMDEIAEAWNRRQG